MKKLVALSLVFLLSAALAAPVFAGEDGKPVTLEGKIICAKCSLKEEGRAECQNVLVVEAGDETQHYYLAKTESNEKFGYVCMAEKPVRVTGKISEKDGKKWLAATEITPTESKS